MVVNGQTGHCRRRALERVACNVSATLLVVLDPSPRGSRRVVARISRGQCFGSVGACFEGESVRVVVG